MKSRRYLLIFLLFLFCNLSASASAEILINQIVLRVNGDVFTLFDLKKLLKPDAPETVPLQDIEARKEKLLEECINNALVKQEISALHLNVSDEEVDRAIETILLQNKKSEEELRKEIAAQGYGWEIYKNEIIKPQLELLNLKRHIAFAALDVDEAVLRSMYDSRFKEEFEFTASHIILTDYEGSYLKIKGIYDEIKSGKITFEEAAKRYSQDDSALSGGSLGTFPASQMAAEFSEKLAEMEEGEISAPFKTRFGWHIAKLFKKEKKAPPSFDKMRDRLRNLYYQEKVDKTFQNWLTKKRGESKIDALF